MLTVLVVSFGMLDVHAERDHAERDHTLQATKGTTSADTPVDWSSRGRAAGF